jgi:hypothetical protein
VKGKDDLVAKKRERRKPLIRAAVTILDSTKVGDTGNGKVQRKGNYNTQEHMQQLFTLHGSGVLTDEEFNTARQRLLRS